MLIGSSFGTNSTGPDQQNGRPLKEVGILLAVAHPPYGEMLQFSPTPKIHFLFNPRSIRVDGCHAEPKRLSDLTRRTAASD